MTPENAGSSQPKKWNAPNCWCGLWIRRECARAQQQNIGITARNFAGMGLSLSKKSNTPVAYHEAEADPGLTNTDMAYNKSAVKDFSRKCEILDAVEAALSPERLNTYRNAVEERDRKLALQLHAWNTAIGAALYGPLQSLEITLRNAINYQLISKFGVSWYENMDEVLDMGALGQIARAREELQRADREVSASQIVAKLPFGFWVTLTGRGGRRNGRSKSNYEMTLWRPALRLAFPYCDSLSRNDLYKSLKRLRDLRNRIAHHEPIFTRNLEADHEEILKLVGWICPETAELIKQHSRVLELLPFRDDLREIKF